MATMWKAALLLVPCFWALRGELAEQFSWNTDPFGDCCSSTNQRYRAVRCNHIFTGRIANASFCDPVTRPCESRPCSCSSIRCSADPDTCFEGVAVRSCGAPALTSSLLGCLPEAVPSAASSTIRNLECMNCTGSEPCLDGLPLYRNMTVMNSDECVRFCVDKGLDIAGFVHARGECRCAASVLDTVYQLSPERRLAGCLRFPDERLMRYDAQACDIQVYRYSGPLEANNVPSALVGMLEQDVRYMNSVVQGSVFTDGDEPEERVPFATSLEMRDGTPGWERHCWPSNCGPGLGPWSVRVPNAPDQDSAPFQEYVVIRYVFDYFVDAGRKEVFREAADRWRRKTCINLVEQGDVDDLASTDVVVGIYDYGSCYVQGMGNQKLWSVDSVSKVNLGWCDSMYYVGNVVHEIGHVLGMNHEQKRPDGAAEYFGHGPYLQMRWENVGSDWVDQWTQEMSTYTGSADDGPNDPHSGYAPYDYGSIMHYPVYDEAVIPDGAITGNWQQLSEGDIRQMLDVYQCKAGPAPPRPVPTPVPTAAYPPSVAPTAFPTEECIDTDQGAVDSYGDGCAEYVGNEHWCGDYDTATFDSLAMCCACGGGDASTAAPTAAPTVAPTAFPTEECIDTDQGAVDSDGIGCAQYVGNEHWCGGYDTATFVSFAMCCACGGGGQCQDNGSNAVDSFGDTCADYVGNDKWCGHFDTPNFDAHSMCCACGGGGVCQNTDVGAVDSYGDACASYVGNAKWCGKYDTPSFNSSSMCCACGGGNVEICRDTDNGEVDIHGDGCALYAANQDWCGRYDTPTFDSMSMCCACRGIAMQPPTEAPTADPTSMPTESPTAVPTSTPTEAPTAVPTSTCPWREGPTTADDTFECEDGHICTGWLCCTGHGDRAKCPPNFPKMCEAAFCGDGTQHCCSTDCLDLGGERCCPTNTGPCVSAAPAAGHLRR